MNGKLIRDEITGKIEPEKERKYRILQNVFIDLPIEVLTKENNILAIRVIGNGNNVGIYGNHPFSIGSKSEIQNHAGLNFDFTFILIFLYFTGYYFIMYLLNDFDRASLAFSIFLIFYIIFHSFQLGYFFPYFENTIYVFRFQSLFLTLAAISNLILFDYISLNKVHPISFYWSVSVLIFALTGFIVPEKYIFNFELIFSIMEIIPIGMLLERFSEEPRKIFNQKFYSNISSHSLVIRISQSLFSAFFKTYFGNFIIIMILLVITIIVGLYSGYILGMPKNFVNYTTSIYPILYSFLIISRDKKLRQKARRSLLESKTELEEKLKENTIELNLKNEKLLEKILEEESLKQQLAVQKERQSIFQDIHDHIGSNIRDLRKIVGDISSNIKVKSLEMENLEKVVQNLEDNLRMKLISIEDMEILKKDFFNGLRLVLFRRYDIHKREINTFLSDSLFEQYELSFPEDNLGTFKEGSKFFLAIAYSVLKKVFAISKSGFQFDCYFNIYLTVL